MSVCPQDVVTYYSENLGQILRGERIVNTPYDIRMNQDSECSVLCSDKTWDKEMSKEAAYRISHEYFVHLIMDNLPCATRFELPDTQEVQYEPGYRLGFSKDGKHFINNHLKFTMRYHKDSEANLYRVVGFLVETHSLDKSSVEIKGELGFYNNKIDGRKDARTHGRTNFWSGFLVINRPYWS